MAVITLDEVQDRCLNGVQFPDGSLVTSHEDGCTEPWIAQAVCALLAAQGGSVVLETGGFKGTTSLWLARTLQTMGGGDLFVAEVDPERADGIKARLDAVALLPATYGVYAEDVLQFMQRIPSRSLDFVWLDDDHQKHHVEQEIVSLWPKMKPGGIICFHDVSSDGVCQLGPLIRKYGGIALDLPRLGPDGGLGIIQVPR